MSPRLPEPKRSENGNDSACTKSYKMIVAAIRSTGLTRSDVLKPDAAAAAGGSRQSIHGSASCCRSEEGARGEAGMSRERGRRDRYPEDDEKDRVLDEWREL